MPESPPDRISSQRVFDGRIVKVDLDTVRAPDGSEMKLEMVRHLSESEGRYDRVSLRLRVPADFPERDRVAIERAMNLCSVKKHILQAPEFETQVESA